MEPVDSGTSFAYEEDFCNFSLLSSPDLSCADFCIDLPTRSLDVTESDLLLLIVFVDVMLVVVLVVMLVCVVVTFFNNEFDFGATRDRSSVPNLSEVFGDGVVVC